MWTRRVIRVMLLLLPCATAMLPHHGDGRGGTDQILNPDRLRPDERHGGEDGPQGGEQEDEKLAPRLQSRSPDDATATTDQNTTSLRDPEPEPEPRSQCWTGPCFGLGEDQEPVGRDLFNALLEGWGREREPEQEDLTRFGLCPDPSGNSSGLDPVLSALANAVEKDRGGLHVLQPTKELWGVHGEHQRRELTLRFLLPPTLRPLLDSLTPTLLFALGGSTGTGGLRASFASESLLPHKQTACILAGTRYVVLTGRQTKDHAHGHLTLRITVEVKQTEEGEKRSLQDLLTGEGAGPNATQGPLLLFRSRTPDSSASPSNGLTPEMVQSPDALASSRTFLFLCALQKFLSMALSPGKLESLPSRAASVSLDVLQSLPPLSLGASSSESLLLGLLNSSAPTVFSFPCRATDLLEHRVELDLQPPLVAILRLRLEEAVTRLVREVTGGCGLRERLQKLQELVSLPGEGGGEAPADMENHREAQYRALLLFKALQVVLGAWEEERGLRSARGGEEGSGRGGTCRLQPLTVSLKSYVLTPDTAAINNCEGACGFPLADANNHAILLNSHEQSGLALGRSLCCVPLEYDDLQVVELKGGGTQITIKPNMVAKKCGCR
ncbi:muellerian-inhibiting factor [Conger conger]|uniref:muellerian-inhibiting factor n=1 Tax=Conger conger TaxID=82655 RepID=UPI002A5A0F02|nr:muellerian-inhibiting factor [Conger conger]